MSRNIKWSRFAKSRVLQIEEALRVSEEKKRVMVIRLSSLGDVVLATSVLSPLQEAGYEVSFVTKSTFSSLFAHHPQIKEVYSFDKKSAGSEAKARQAFFIWAESKQFSMVIDLHDSWRTWRWRAKLKKMAPVYVAKKERLREWLILLFRFRETFSFRRGGRAKKFRRCVTDALLQEKAYATANSALTKLNITSTEKEAIKGILPTSDFVAFLPGSAWEGKQWPYFPELAEIFARKVPVVALGSDKDLVCDEVAKQAQKYHSESRSLRGKTSMRESLAVLAQAKWVIGNDTGFVHAAEALGKDVAMIEGPTHESMGFSPYKESSILLGLPLICRPCSKSGKFCPRFGSRKCLFDLTAAMVAESLRRKGYPC